MEPFHTLSPSTTKGDIFPVDAQRGDRLCEPWGAEEEYFDFSFLRPDSPEPVPTATESSTNYDFEHDSFTEHVNVASSRALCGGVHSASSVYTNDGGYMSRHSSAIGHQGTIVYNRPTSPDFRTLAAVSRDTSKGMGDSSTDFRLSDGTPTLIYNIPQSSTSSSETHDSGYISSYPETSSNFMFTPVSNDNVSPLIQTGPTANKRPKKTKKPKNQHQCDLCPKTYASAQSLRRHRNANHSGVESGRNDKHASSKHSKKPQEDKQVEATIPDTLPRFQSILANTQGQNLDILSRQKATVFREKVDWVQKSSLFVETGGHQIRGHISDIICALQELLSKGSPEACNTVVDCIFFHDNDEPNRKIADIYTSLVSFISSIRTMELLPVAIVLSVRSLSQLEEADLGVKLFDIKSKSKSRAKSCITTCIRIRDKRYAIAKFSPSDTNASLTDSLETMSRIQTSFAEATAVKAEETRPIDEHQNHEMNVANKRRYDDEDEWVDEDSSPTSACGEEEENDGIEEEDGSDEDEEEETQPFSFLPFFFGGDREGRSPTDSTDSGSSSNGSGNNSTPTSFSSENIGGTQHGSHQGSQARDCKDGSVESNSDPRVDSGQEEDTQPRDTQPLPLVCWHAAAGLPCREKRTARNRETRRLFPEHTWGKNKPSCHRLPSKCQQCLRLFESQKSLDAHIDARRNGMPGVCITHSDEDLIRLNRHPQTLGLSEKMKEDIDKLRSKLTLSNLPKYCDEPTLKSIRSRVESNLHLYMNGSSITESSARLELWKWYIIFKRLRPDDEIPSNPFTTKCVVTVPEQRAQANILRIHNSNIDQFCANGSLPRFTELQRAALNQAFLNTLEMQGALESEARKPKKSKSETTGQASKKRTLSPEESGGPSKKRKLSPEKTGQTITPKFTPTPAAETGQSGQLLAQTDGADQASQVAPLEPPRGLQQQKQQEQQQQQYQDQNHQPPLNLDDQTQKLEAQSSSSGNALPPDPNSSNYDEAQDDFEASSDDFESLFGTSSASVDINWDMPQGPNASHNGHLD